MRRFYILFVLIILKIFLLDLSAKIDSRYVIVDLKKYFNNDGIAWPHKPEDGNFDGGGWNYAAEFIPVGDAYQRGFYPKATLLYGNQIPFKIEGLQDGENNNISCDGQEIKIPEGFYSKLYFLIVAENGDYKEKFVFKYKNKKEKKIISVNDWCKEPGDNEYVALLFPYRYKKDVGKTPPPNQIFFQEISLDYKNKLVQITLPKQSHIHLFAVTFRKYEGEKLNEKFENQKEFFDYLISEDESVKALWDKYKTIETLLTLPNTQESVKKFLKRFYKLRRDFWSYLEPEKYEQNVGKLKRVGKEIDNLLEETKRNFQKNKDINFYIIGQSHIDAAWLWRWRDTVKKCYNTFKSALENMKEYPHFLYAQSSPRFYKWMEEYYPEIFKEIKKRVKEGRWILTGGMWIEPDCNLPDGESFVRQRLYGCRYFLEKFGRYPEIEWLPDTFGWPWTLPQIFKKTGAKYFWSTKLLWNDTNEFPYSVFRWQSPDGTQIIVNMGPSTLIMNPTPDMNLIYKWKKKARLYKSKTKKKLSDEYAKECMIYYGEGDGGGGPTVKMVRAAEKSEKIGLAKQVSPEFFFHKLDKYFDRLPVWNDELYLEYHRGTYTSQGIVKKWNRHAEVLAIESEIFSSIAMRYGFKYPENFRKIWEKICFNQFHDILPGSAIRPVYFPDAERDYEFIFSSLNKILDNALDWIIKNINIEEQEGIPIVVFNPLPWKRKDLVKVKWNKEEKMKIVSSDNVSFPAQIIEEDDEIYLAFVADVPAWGYNIYYAVPSMEEETTTSFVNPYARNYSITRDLSSDKNIFVSQTSLSSSYFDVTLNRKGWVSYIYDKENDKVLLENSPIKIRLFKDKPKEWDNWNIGKDYNDKEIYFDSSSEIKIIEKGPIRAGISVSHTYDDSTITHIVYIYRDIPRIEFNDLIDWNNHRILMKVQFPFKIDYEYIVTEIPYGVYFRPKEPKNKFEEAKWEWPAHKWVDISDGKYGATVVNNCKYGYDNIEGKLRMTLLKSGRWPDKNADIGEHNIKYAIYPHSADWKKSKAWRWGQEFNYKLIGKVVKPHSGKLSEKKSFVKVEPDNVFLKVMKKAEDNNDIILRLYEVAGKNNTSVKIKLPWKIKEAWEIDFLELKNLKKLKYKNNEIRFNIKKFEIKAIRVKYELSGK